jgi:DNA-binding LacI/PurR family transcriptional regulator
VSVATVSFVLNEAQRHRIRPKTQDKVFDAVKELGYSPNVSARNLAVGRSHILGVIVSDIRNPFFPEITAAFQEAANLNDMEAIVIHTNYDAQRTKESVSRLLALQVPGVAVLTSQVDPSVMELLASRGVCAVYLDLGRVDRCVRNHRCTRACSQAGALAYRFYRWFAATHISAKTQERFFGGRCKIGSHGGAHGRFGFYSAGGIRCLLETA